MADATRKLRVFCSYSHNDTEWLKKIRKAPAQLQRDEIELWRDRAIVAGMDWVTEIDAELERADIGLLLVSQNFIASDCCTGVEMKRALKRRREGRAVVVPVLLEPCYYANVKGFEMLAIM